MKQTTIQIPFDEEKIEALNIFIVEKGTTVDAELLKALDEIYSKYVPIRVREFLSKKEERTITKDNENLRRTKAL